ncbi:MAG: InlB B-repeat-containing protein [Peptococcaceae bacterium]|nr:InlB B-repeat-containing protein [Peptococcaceae bacterium]
MTAKHGADIRQIWPINGTDGINYESYAWYDTGNTYDYPLVTLEKMPASNVTFEGENRGTQKTIYYYAEVLNGQTGAVSFKGRQFNLYKSVANNFNYITYDEEYHPIDGFDRYSKSDAGFDSNGRKDFYKGAVSLYYKRLSYSLTFYNVNADAKTESVQYQAPLSGFAGYVPGRPAGVDPQWTFQGWYANPSGTGNSFDFTGNVMPAGNLILYAKWAPPAYKVTAHHVSTGLGEYTEIPVGYGQSLDSASLPQLTPPQGLEAGDFLGWYWYVEGKLMAYNYSYVLTKNIELYPQWNGGAYSLTYDIGSGQGAQPVDSRSYGVGSKAAVLEGSQLSGPDGASFLYWTDGGVNKYYPNDWITVTGNITLNAVYGKVNIPQVTITYNANFGASPTTYAGGPIPANSKFTVLAAADCGSGFVREGYSFNGWNTQAGGNGTVFAAGSQARADQVPENILYAQWQFVDYTVTYEYTGTVPAGAPAVPAKLENKHIGDAVAVANRPSLKGYEFKGWYYQGNVVSSFTMPASNVKLTGSWEKSTYTVTYNKGAHGTLTGQNGEGNVIHSNLESGAPTPNAPAVTAAAGYYFTGWDPEVAPNVIGNAVYVAQYGTQTPLSLTVSDKAVTYNGQEQSGNTIYTVNGLKPGHHVDSQATGYTAAKGKDVGNYTNGAFGTIIVKDGNGNDVTKQYSVTPVPGKLAVGQRQVNLTSASGSKAYDGTALTRPAVTVGGDGFVSGEATAAAQGTITDVGSVTNTIQVQPGTGYKAGNYAINKNEGTLTITPKLTEIVITAAGGSKKYDGSPLTNAGYSYTQDVLVQGDVLTAVVEGTITDAGTADNVVKSYQVMRGSTNVTGNYTFGQSVKGTLTITKRQVSLTSESATKAYDGAALTRPAVTVGGDGFISGEATAAAQGTITDVGSVTNTIQIQPGPGYKEGNYATSKNEGTLTITSKVNVIIITAASGSKKYDGSPLTNAGYSYTQDVLVQGDVLTAVVEGTITDAGTADNVVKSYQVMRGGSNVTGNYTFGQSVKGTLTVSPREVSLTSASDSKAYDGTALTNAAVTPGGADGFIAGEGASYNVTGSQTEMGSSNNTFTYTLNTNTKAANYTITPVNGTLTVTSNQTEIVITAKSASRKYDGTPLTESGYETTGTLPAGHSLRVTVSGSITDAGTETNTAGYKIYNNSNQEVTGSFSGVTTVNGTLTVSPREVSLTSASDSKAYDGTALTNAAVTPGGDGFITGEGASYEVSGSQTDVGSSNNTFTYTLNADTKAANYTVTPVYGTLTVTPAVGAPLEIGNYAGVYDGKDHSISIKNLIAGDEVLYLDTRKASAGENGDLIGAYYEKELPVANEVTGPFTVLVKVTNSNYADRIGEGTITVTARPLTITAASDSKTYDGKPLTNAGYSITAGTLAEQQELIQVDVAGSQTSVGSSSNVAANAVIKTVVPALQGAEPQDQAAAVEVTGNYDISYVNGTLTVRSGGGSSDPDPDPDTDSDSDPEPVVPAEPEVIIQEPEVPLAELPEIPGEVTGDGTIIIDENVPLGNLPQTGTMPIEAAQQKGMAVMLPEEFSFRPEEEDQGEEPA